jgi:hypothetical protein
MKLDSHGVQPVGFVWFSSAADEGDDFQAVALFENALGVHCAGNQFAIALDGDVSRLHLHLFEQIGNRRSGGDVPLLVVHLNIHRRSCVCFKCR